MSTEIVHNADAKRYTLSVDGSPAAVLEYQDHGSGTAFHHTVTMPNHRGQGYAGQLVEYAVDEVEREGRGPIIASCSYVAHWFEKNPDRQNLLQA